MEDDAFEQSSDTSVVCQHQTRDARSMRAGGVWGCAGQGDLDGGRAPGDEGCEAALTDAKKRFVDLFGVSSLLKW